MSKTNPEDAHYLLSEDREHSIYQVWKALECIASLAGDCKDGFFPSISSEQVSCLLSILADRLPRTEDMKFVTSCAKEKPLSHPASDTGDREGEV